MISVVVDSVEMRWPMRGLEIKVKDPCFLLRVSQACQSTSHLKSDSKIFFGQFLMTKVTAGQQMEQPKRRI